MTGDWCIRCKRDIDKMSDHWELERGHEVDDGDGIQDFVFSGERTLYLCDACVEELTKR